MKKLGFTLIELLAVILILGIIALIAIPTVNTIINDSKKQAFLVTSRQIADVVSDKCNINAMKGQNDSGTYSIQNGKILYDVDMKGDLPDSGTININDECEVEIISYQDQMCSYKNYDDDSLTIGELVDGVCEINDIPVNIEVLPNNSSCFMFDAATGTITDYDIHNPSCQGAVVIPEKIDGVNVAEIADGAFIEDYAYLIQISTLDAITYTYDLLDSSNLMPFDIIPVNSLPSDLKKTCYPTSEKTNGVQIGYNDDSSAYKWCKFDNFTLEKSQKVKTTQITSIDFSKAIHLQKIGRAISDSGVVSKVTFGSLPELVYLGADAFDNNNIMGTLDLSGLTALTKIESRLFTYNNIENTIFNENVKQIWHFAFEKNMLTNLQLPSSLEYIGIQAFDLNDIRNLVLPDKLTNISHYAFYRNENMNTLTIGSSLKYISQSIFKECGLNTVDFSKANSIEYIEISAFENNNLKDIDVNAKEYDPLAFADNLLETVNIGSRVTKIYDTAFSNNPNLSLITMNSAYRTGAPWGAPSTCVVTQAE